MSFMTSNEIRESFLSFFEKKQHSRVSSSSLIPGNDPTLLFTNAGMVQFKECFLGQEVRDYVRATTSQRCVRAGGKHNDLENVGYTARHHTFFEMLGNFSFGDYFKEEAIRFAWEFLTEELQLPAEKLWVTVYKDDKEAEDIWFEKIGIDQERFSRLGDKDNFWAMGDTGPCGPCSEIFYDHGEDVAGGPPGSPDEDGDRYIEIWNLVFMQFNRDKQGELTNLPKPSVDTGMGLERVAAVMQHVHSNYEIDLFDGLIKSIAKLLMITNLHHKSLRVIADHIRSCSFLISDGVIPSNEGRGYVLRRIIRRAIRHGHKLGADKAFFHKLVPALCKQMGEAYPELIERKEQIQSILLREEEQFARTLDNGMKILEQDLSRLSGTVVSGQTVFTLYDTYGFPEDLTADIARERQLTIDKIGFDALMKEQKERSKEKGKFDHDYNDSLSVDIETEFKGYDSLNGQAQAELLLKDGEEVLLVSKAQEALVITQTTPFYAESGGQVGDFGVIEWEGGRADVVDTQKINKAFSHKIKVIEGELKKNDSIILKVDAARRQATAVNHSATHLLHAALRSVLGEHVEQKGSLVNSERLRFDFSHPEPVTAKQIQAIELLVNKEIQRNTNVDATVMSMDEAKEKGAMALFGEKYGNEVRVLSMGDFSVELCGGTHVSRTGDIGVIKVVQESGIAAGVRRIEAVAGEGAFQLFLSFEKTINNVASQLKTDFYSIEEKTQQLVQKTRDTEKQLEKLKSQMASNQGAEILTDAVNVAGIQLIAKVVKGVDGKGLRDLMDQIKSKLDSGVIALGVENNGKANLIVGVTKDLVSKIKAGEIVNFAAEKVGGKGGGRPDMAQAGGPNPEHLEAAIESVSTFISDCMNN